MTTAADTIPDTRTNTCAIIALFSALVALALPAVAFGIIGMRQSTRRDENGWGMAFAGVVLGGVELIIGVAWLTVFMSDVREGVAIQW